MEKKKKSNNRIKQDETIKQSSDNIKREIEENYKIGIEYYKDVEKDSD